MSSVSSAPGASHTGATTNDAGVPQGTGVVVKREERTIRRSRG